ncbi:ABC transporter substrate-binding protein [Dactylosporangium sp. CA-092794]|uniref:ABC transporter substrate-binding protein n=1 Tax=Dactylosporangium sp. CA-092794 TaxID=3239929 RepID=UPI003D8A2283
MSAFLRRVRRRPAVVLATAVVTALAVSGCGATSASSAGSSGGAKGATPGYNASTKTFAVSAILPLSGSLAPAGTAISAGEKIFFDALNAKGGVSGKYKVDYKAEDSQYNPQTTVPLYSRIKGDNVLISGLLGTAIINTLKPQFATDNMTVVADSSSGALLREPHLLPYGSSTQTNMINLAAYAAQKLGHQSDVFCSVTQADDLGKENRDGVQFAVTELGLKFGVDAAVQQTDTNFTPQIQKLKNAGCQVVMLGATTGQVPGLIAAAVQLGYQAQWMGQSNVYDPSFASSPIAPYLKDHLLTALIGVDWDNAAPGMVALREAFDKYGKAASAKQSSFTQLGYAHGMLVEAILQQAVANDDFTRAGILKASQQVGDFDYGGILPKFGYHDPDKRTAPLVTSIFKVDPSKPMGLAPESVDYGTPAASKFVAQ